MIEIKLNMPFRNPNSLLGAKKPNFYKANFVQINNFLNSQPWNNIICDKDDIDTNYSPFSQNNS